MRKPDLQEELVSRFFRYAAIESQSDATSAQLPSSTGQAKLAALLAEELVAMGLHHVFLDECAILTAVKKGTRPAAARVGFIAHLDTVDVGLSPIVRPQLFHFDGSDLRLNSEHDIWLRVTDHPEILPWKDQDIIVSDGTSVLGADNKAAIAVIMTLLSRLTETDPHGDIAVAFVPDEEIGLRGAKALELSRFPCDFAYTIDCCGLGEVVVENFNAATCQLTFTGVSAHPMTAKDNLVNPLSMAFDFIGCFDRNDTPECTSGRQGFFWFKDLVANDTRASLNVLIRDFDRSAFAERKAELVRVADLIRSRYPAGAVDLTIEDTYHNIGDHLARDDRAARLLFQALADLRIECRPLPMRGGTDGAALSARGLPTPNFFTGAHNFHSKYEFLPVSAFEQSFQVAFKLCELAGRLDRSVQHFRSASAHDPVQGRDHLDQAPRPIIEAQ